MMVVEIRGMMGRALARVSRKPESIAVLVFWKVHIFSSY